MQSIETKQFEVADVVKLIQESVRSERPYVVEGNADLPVKLNQNESPFDLPVEVKAELLEAYRGIPFNRYPREHPDRLAAALAERLSVAPDAVLVGNGSNELSYLLGLCILREGVSVVLPRPMFSLYEKVARMYRAGIVPIPPREDLSFDAGAILDAVVREQPALTILTSPNNPTGTAMRFGEIESIVRRSRGIVVVDEAYVEFNEEPPASELLAAHANLLVMRTFSKALGLAGLRIGYLVGHHALLAEFRKARLPFVVDPLAEATALMLLDHEELVREHVAELRRGRQFLEAELRMISGLRIVPSQANFVIFRPSQEPAEVMARLAEAGVLVRDVGGYPELRGFLRVNAGTSHENRAFLTALKNALSA